MFARGTICNISKYTHGRSGACFPWGLPRYKRWASSGPACWRSGQGHELRFARHGHELLRDPAFACRADQLLAGGHEGPMDQAGLGHRLATEEEDGSARLHGEAADLRVLGHEDLLRPETLIVVGDGALQDVEPHLPVERMADVQHALLHAHQLQHVAAAVY